MFRISGSDLEMTGENRQQTLSINEQAALVVDVEPNNLQELCRIHASFTKIAGHDDVSPLAQRLALELGVTDVVAPLDKVSEEILGAFNRLQAAAH